MLLIIVYVLWGKILYLWILLISAFSSIYILFLYFTSSNPTFFTLPINFYNIPHISLFILQYIQLKYCKIILFFLFFHNPNHIHFGNSKQSPNPPQHKSTTPTPTTQINHQTHCNIKSTTPTPTTQINHQIHRNTNQPHPR